MVVEKATLTVAEASKVIGLSKNRTYDLCAESVIPHLRLGGRIVIPIQALERWLADAGKGRAERTGDGPQS